MNTAQQYSVAYDYEYYLQFGLELITKLSLKMNKNAFQSKAHLPLANRKSKHLQFDLAMTLTLV